MDDQAANEAESERHEANGKDRAEAEKKEAEERSAPTPSVVWQAIYAEGRDELARGWRQLAWSALAAGLSMGFSLITEGLLRRYLPETGWRPLVTKLGYSMGFLIVVLGRQQLFTENTLTVVLPLLHRRNAEAAGSVARLWAVVLVGNLVGAAAVAWVVAHTGVFDEEAKRAFAEVSLEGTGAAFGLWQADAQK